MNGPAQPPVAKHPLVLLALSLAAGILVFNYLHSSKLAIASALAAALLLTIVMILRPSAAMVLTLLVIAFPGTGYLLALIETRSVAPDRLVRMFAGGALQSNEPVEVTGIIQGEPEPSPDGFYL